MAYTLSESPVVVVLSGSMEPAFQRGDILFLNNQDTPIRVGEVVVFKIKGRDIPIVHRVLEVHEWFEPPSSSVRRDVDNVVSSSSSTGGRDKSARTTETYLLTKGDNNRIDDRTLYAAGQQWLKKEDILGRAVGTLRYVGMVTIYLNDYPALKFVLVSLMGLFVLTNKEG